MGTEIFTFGPLEPEKMGFKDSKPTFEIMTKTALLWSEFFAILGDWLLCIFFTLVKVNENLSTSMRISILKFVVMEDSKTKIWLAIPGIGFEVLQMCIQFICCHFDLFQMLIIVYCSKLLFVWQAFRCPDDADLYWKNTGWFITQYGKKIQIRGELFLS